MNHSPTLPSTIPLAEMLVRQFGSQSKTAQDRLRSIYGALPPQGSKQWLMWQTFFGPWAALAVKRAPRHLEKLAKRYSLDNPNAESLLYTLQAYYAAIIQHVANTLVGRHGTRLLEKSPFAWFDDMAPSWQTPSDAAWSQNHLLSMPKAAPSDAVNGQDCGECDLFKALYHDLFPRPLRHAWGEYYTPDWLAAHVLDQLDYPEETAGRLLDPSCGSGTFLMMALRRLRKAKPLTTKFLAEPSFIVGFDMNPLAVLAARANYLIAVADLLPAEGSIETPIYLCDSIRGLPEMPWARDAFDYIAGNPPWIAWDNLPEADRTVTKPLWERYGLFSLSGNEARHGGGKKDLSMLMLYATADRYLKSGGRLGMVITQTLFQSRGAGDGFRRFCLGHQGPALGVLRVDDMVVLKPFEDAANWTSTVVLEKGVATQYPVPYFQWSESSGKRCAIEAAACPIDPAQNNSPWRIHTDRDTPKSGPADYVARLGANSGGANGVYWVELLETTDEDVRIRNHATQGKRSLTSIERVIEPDLLYPLLRWSDISRYSAVPRGHILLAQEPTSRTGIDPSLMHSRWPLTLDYLEQFRPVLLQRAAYRRYQGQGPFYAMYNVGPYTIAPIKVVWRRMDRQINAAVVEEVDDPILGRRPVVPQETCVLIACDSTEEAHYLCAMLNSGAVNEIVSASSVRGGKGFGTPGMLRYVPLKRFCPEDPRHMTLAQRSAEAHTGRIATAQREIDLLAAELLKSTSAI